MAKSNNITSPRGEVIGFCAVQKPALNYNKDGEEYQIKVAFEAEAVEGLMESLTALRDAKRAEVIEEAPQAKRKALEKTMKDAEIGTDELDEEGDPTGRVIIKFKQKSLITGTSKGGKPFEIKKKVGLFDSRGANIKAAVKLGAGSIVKVSFEPNPYFSAKDKEVGVSFNRLSAVQLIKLVEFEGSGVGSAEDHGFGAEDEDGGFDASDYVGEDQTDEDGTDDMGPEDF